jgi:hypothetical protein
MEHARPKNIPKLEFLRMKIEKAKFDTLLGKVPHTKPEPRKAVRMPGRKGPETRILSR